MTTTRKAVRGFLIGLVIGLTIDASLTLLAVGDPHGWAWWRVAVFASPAILVGAVGGALEGAS